MPNAAQTRTHNCHGVARHFFVFVLVSSYRPAPLLFPTDVYLTLMASALCSLLSLCVLFPLSSFPHLSWYISVLVFVLSFRFSLVRALALQPQHSSHMIPYYQPPLALPSIAYVVVARRLFKNDVVVAVLNCSEWIEKAVIKKKHVSKTLISEGK
jgi:hypothetical protein